MTLLAAIPVTTAVVLYSIAVWAERITGTVKRWHFALLVAAAFFQTVATGVLYKSVAGFSIGLGGVAMMAALIMVIMHARWALVTMLRKDAKTSTQFNRFSVLVWAAWLVLFAGPLLWMRAFSLGGV